MENPTSFLFSGLHFNRKKFADDFARFSVKSNETVEKEEEPEPEPEAVVVSGEKKKRKRNGKTEVNVEGFNVFKTSDSVVDVDEKTKKKKKKIEDVITEQKKEVNRQIERDALFRKKHGIHISGHNVPSPLQNFAELSSRYKCEPYLLHNLAELGFKEPTPIQRQAIPVLLSGRECFACAATGSGKTLAFLLPMLVKLKPGSTDGVQAVIICPTRELAAQTTRECRKLAKGKGFFVKLMTKELVTNGDFKKMHCDILVSTPRRLQFAIRKRKLNLTRVAFLVLDESDKLFELGFVKQIDLVVKACSNPSIIRSLFSATLPDSVEELARSIMHDAVRVIIGRKNSASELIKQKLVFTGSEEGKLLAIRQSFAESLNPPVLVFVQSKERAKELYRELAFDDIRVDCIHADLSQTERDDAVDNFRAGKTWVLIATDVISRGMDFKGVNCVINYDFPETASGYIHRIGRTGRAGRAGEAITLFTEDDIPFLRNIANVMTASGCEVPSWIMNLSKLRRRKHRPRRDSISTKPKAEEKEVKEKEREELLKRQRKPRSSKKSIRAKSKSKAKEEEKEGLPKRMKKPRLPKKSITAKPEDEVASDKLKKKKKKEHRPSSDPVTTKPKQTKEKTSPKLRTKKRSLSEDSSQQSKKSKKVR